ncbi:MAG TPA: response regulator [Candidatus Saccharimonadia bacterium]
MQKILMIEDDPLVGRLYKRVFELEGFTIEWAENGQDGLDKVKTMGPDIILLDVMMKGLNGLEVLTRLKDEPKTAGIPVLVLTNVSDARITQLATEKGAVAAMVKSETEPEGVVGMIKGILAKAGK